MTSLGARRAAHCEEHNHKIFCVGIFYRQPLHWGCYLLGMSETKVVQLAPVSPPDVPGALRKLADQLEQSEVTFISAVVVAESTAGVGVARLCRVDSIRATGLLQVGGAFLTNLVLGTPE